MKYFIVNTHEQKQDMIEVKKLNAELQLYGFQMNEEDLAFLRNEQKIALKQNRLVDVDDQIIFTIADVVKKSPYPRYEKYIALVKDFLHAFYACKSRSSCKLYDDEVVAIMFQCYLKNYGEVSIKMIHDTLKKMDKHS